MNWQDYKTAFEWDGSWRDIYVLDTNINDWQRLLDFLRESSYVTIYHGLTGPELPETMQEIFEIQKTSFSSMSIDIGQIRVNCHFFLESEIEFDIDPRDIDSEEKLTKIFDFMQRIGNLLNKEVILTEENSEDEIWFKFVPGSEAVQFISSK